MYNKQMSFSNGRFIVHYFYDPTTDIVHFKLVAVNVTGWMGIGLSRSSNLSSSGFDMIAGGQYSNGTSFLVVC